MNNMKERLDVLLVKRNLADSRVKAKAIIMSGNVFVEGQREDKAGTTFPEEVQIEIKGHTLPYVSRGGLKLEKAMKVFDVTVEGKVCTDVGSSTGGFTDCLLQNGAKFVYAADVGYGQLDWKIRSDERVKTIERTNLKNCAFEEIYSKNEPIADLLVSDLSFISLTKVLPNLKNLLSPDFHEMILLIKPQFEAGKEKVEKGGVVRDKKVHQEVIENVINCAKELNYSINDLTFSSIKGPSGNIEYLIWLSSHNENKTTLDIKNIVETAFEILNK